MATSLLEQRRRSADAGDGRYSPLHPRLFLGRSTANRSTGPEGPPRSLLRSRGSSSQVSGLAHLLLYTLGSRTTHASTPDSGLLILRYSVLSRLIAEC